MQIQREDWKTVILTWQPEMASNKGNSGVQNFTVSHPRKMCVSAPKTIYKNVYRIIKCSSKQLKPLNQLHQP